MFVCLLEVLLTKIPVAWLKIQSWRFGIAWKDMGAWSCLFLVRPPLNNCNKHIDFEELTFIVFTLCSLGAASRPGLFVSAAILQWSMIASQTSSRQGVMSCQMSALWSLKLEIHCGCVAGNCQAPWITFEKLHHRLRQRFMQLLPAVPKCKRELHMSALWKITELDLDTASSLYCVFIRVSWHVMFILRSSSKTS